MKFKDYFRSSRKAAKLTQQKIADRFEIDRVSVSNWEQGHLPLPPNPPRRVFCCLKFQERKLFYIKP